MNKPVLAAFALWVVTLAPALPAQEAAGPPAPVPHTTIPDPADDAVRHIVVKAENRGPVWLLTGLLSSWNPRIDFEMLARLKPRHWRQEAWPIWYPISITENAASNGRESWGDWRGSPAAVGQYLETMMRLQARGMTWQPVLHHKGRYYGRYGIPADMLADYYEHIHTLVQYSRSMGMPFDYYEICNEPGGRDGADYEDERGYTFKGNWVEFLGMWDTAYRAIRDACPEARIVGPSYGPSYEPEFENLAPFLDHCMEKGQKLDVLSWHMPSLRTGQKGERTWIEPDGALRQIEAARSMVREKYASLGIAEFHIDEWGIMLPYQGPGTTMAILHYLDLAGVERAARSQWGQGPLDGLLVNNTTPRTSYWCWVEYAKQDGGVRLITETNDRNLVALASRHDNEQTVRVLLSRAKRNYGNGPRARRLPPVRATIDLEGVPVTGPAEIRITRLGPGDVPTFESDLTTTRQVVTVAAGSLSFAVDKVRENQVYSITVQPDAAAATPAATERAAPAPTAQTEDFNAHAATDDWEPAAESGWIVPRNVPPGSKTRVALGQAFGRDDSTGLAGVRKESAAQVSYWHAELDGQLDTLGLAVMVPAESMGVEISTKRAGTTAGVISVGYKDRIKILHRPGGA